MTPASSSTGVPGAPAAGTPAAAAPLPPPLMTRAPSTRMPGMQCRRRRPGPAVWPNSPVCTATSGAALWPSSTCDRDPPPVERHQGADRDREHPVLRPGADDADGDRRLVQVARRRRVGEPDDHVPPWRWPRRRRPYRRARRGPVRRRARRRPRRRPVARRSDATGSWRSPGRWRRCLSGHGDRTGSPRWTRYSWAHRHGTRPRAGGRWPSAPRPPGLDRGAETGLRGPWSRAAAPGA